jgi:hypothetical protein
MAAEGISVTACGWLLRMAPTTVKPSPACGMIAERQSFLRRCD